jgi:hypothetical protein
MSAGDAQHQRDVRDRRRPPRRPCAPFAATSGVVRGGATEPSITFTSTESIRAPARHHAPDVSAIAARSRCVETLEFAPR